MSFDATFVFEPIIIYYSDRILNLVLLGKIKVKKPREKKIFTVKVVPNFYQFSARADQSNSIVQQKWTFRGAGCTFPSVFVRSLILEKFS